MGTKAGVILCVGVAAALGAHAARALPVPGVATLAKPAAPLAVSVYLQPSLPAWAAIDPRELSAPSQFRRDTPPAWQLGVTASGLSSWEVSPYLTLSAADDTQPAPSVGGFILGGGGVRVQLSPTAAFHLDYERTVVEQKELAAGAARLHLKF